ncbi:MAG TPA: hypothetical protein VFK12_10495 [Gammaproteobacteria bacterium]|nr:hypothetical protein [Gammaproteobacteria bacterium]
MTYDPDTMTITIGEYSDFMSDSGAFFIDVFRREAAAPNAPEALRNDWEILENWLGCAGRPLSTEDNTRISAAWRSYLAIGVAPSRNLQPQFDLFHEQYTKSGVDIEASKPPSEVMDVFDRLLATDAEIRKKKKEDWDAERKKLEPLLKGLGAKKNVGWWRRKSKAFRLWAFVSLIWAVGVVLFVAVFDPFHNGSWNYMDDDEFLEMFTVMALPVFAGVLFRIYKKFVE